MRLFGLFRPCHIWELIVSKRHMFYVNRYLVLDRIPQAFRSNGPDLPEPARCHL